MAASCIRTQILFGLAGALALTLAACGEWHGADDVSTDVGGGKLGSGPGLFTGKRGGIVIYQDAWSGASPGGDKAE
jgi:hypothetical protein